MIVILRCFLPLSKAVELWTHSLTVGSLTLSSPPCLVRSRARYVAPASRGLRGAPRSRDDATGGGRQMRRWGKAATAPFVLVPVYFFGRVGGRRSVGGTTRKSPLSLRSGASAPLACSFGLIQHKFCFH